MAKIKRTFSRIRRTWRRLLSKSSTPDPVLSATPVCDNPRINSPLEDFPPEIRLQLLSLLELDGLSALVHASPVFHQQYRQDRRFILCKSLEVTMRSVTVDACHVYRSSSAIFAKERTTENITQFLVSYQDQQTSTKYSILNEMLTEDEVVEMVAFHNSTIKPLARLYTGWALANLANEAKDSGNQKPLSKMEETRLLRALYRFQLCCNVLGKGPHGIYLDVAYLPTPVSNLTIFIRMFEPWEVEEIACIYNFIKEKYNQILVDISWDVHQENPKFGDQIRPPTPKGAFDLSGDTFDRNSYLEGTISRGLALAHTVFFTIKDHEHLVTLMQEHLTRSGASDLFNDEGLDEMSQYIRRREHRSNRDQKQEQRDPLPFVGDEESDAKELRPPLAWTLIWRGTYSYLYGYYVQEDIRRWGYVLWDAERLRSVGAKEVLARQWEAYWGGE